MADLHKHLDYWDAFYSSEARARVPEEPSGFARWVAAREAAPGPLIDVGSGTGRDTLWFGRNGYRAVGLDYSESAVRLAAAHADQQELDTSFAQLDLYESDDVDDLGAKLATEVAPRLVYARFLVHALEDDGRRNLWRLTRALLPSGGRLYLEFRVRHTEHEFGEHYRRFVPAEAVAAELVEHGALVEHREVATGLAVYKHEDPLVCRLAASWS
jgi:SAM-dependent methyltransferase